MKFANISRALICLAVMSGCSTQLGGSGEMSNGEPLSVLLNVDMTAVDSITTVDLVSLEGWRCQSVLKDPSSSSKARQTYPMTCSDGATGILMLTWDALQQRQNGAFKLNNGKSGRVTFDFKR